MEEIEKKVEKPTTLADRARDTLNALAYPIAAVAGYYTGDLEIRMATYKNFAKHGTFNDLQKIRAEQYRSAIETATAGAPDHLAENIQVIEDAYRAGVRTRFENLGLSTYGDYWKTLMRNQKVTVMERCITTTGITLGALLVISSKDWAKELLGRIKPDAEISR